MTFSFLVLKHIFVNHGNDPALTNPLFIIQERNHVLIYIKTLNIVLFKISFLLCEQLVLMSKNRMRCLLHISDFLGIIVLSKARETKRCTNFILLF